MYWEKMAIFLTSTWPFQGQLWAIFKWVASLTPYKSLRFWFSVRPEGHRKPGNKDLIIPISNKLLYFLEEDASLYSIFSWENPGNFCTKYFVEMLSTALRALMSCIPLSTFTVRVFNKQKLCQCWFNLFATTKWKKKWSSPLSFCLDKRIGLIQKWYWYDIVIVALGVLQNGALNNFPKFTRKHLCCSLFLIKLRF